MNPPFLACSLPREEEKVYDIKLEKGHIMIEGIISPEMPRRRNYISVVRDWLYGNPKQ